MEQISPYYSFYIKGGVAAKSNSLIKLKNAAEYFEKALKYKETEQAYHQLLICYMKLDNNDSYKKTLLKAVKSGFTVFYSTCGYYYANNKVDASEKDALYWYEKGIEANESRAFYDLGNLYLSGCNAFKADICKAEELYKKGLELNDSKYNGYFYWSLGSICFGKKQYDTAKKYFEKAIDSEYFQASFNLALMYRDGLGVEKNVEKYMEYLMMHLSVDSALEIASIYLLGKYAPQDDEISFAYFNHAANKGNAFAAIMCAAFLVEKESFDEKQLNGYLEIFFSKTTNDSDVQSCFDVIEEEFGTKMSDKLREYAKKYWNLRRGQA